MKTIWDRIHVWLAANAPEVLASLRPGASKEAIRAAEREMGVTLPEDVKACYRIHDGQMTLEGQDWPPGFLHGLDWFSLDDVLADWRVKMSVKKTYVGHRSEPDGPIRVKWWHPAWIALATNNAGQWYCLDLAPKRGGQVGQIITWFNDDPLREIEADSFTEWLELFADDLEEGIWVTDPSYSGLVSFEDV